MYKLNNMKALLLWDWLDFGIVFKINTLMHHSNYYFAIDIQIGWLNLWVQFWRKKINKLNK
jgi:hypothetical protein